MRVRNTPAISMPHVMSGFVESDAITTESVFVFMVPPRTSA